jgi:hypothetical protein
MLTPQDDLLGHQTPRPFAVPGNSHENFTERYWYTGHPVDGSEVLLDCGLGYYPNKGVMDAFAGVTIGRQQFNFRASRRLGANPLQTHVGPLQLDIDTKTGKHRLVLAENSSGISMDVTFEPVFPAGQEKQSYRERKGVVEEDLARVTQFGRWRGWIVANGKRWQLTPETWWGQRDRSWGLRSPMKTDHDAPPVQTHAGFFWTWSMLQFERSAICLFVKEREPGKPWYLSCTEFRRDASGAVSTREGTSVAHEIEWAHDPLGQTIASAELKIEFEHGAPRTVRMEGLPIRFYLKGGLYGGYGGWNHGDDRGDYHEAHDVWDLDDAATRQKARTLSDHVLRLSSEGESGIGISEYGVATGYPRYEEVHQFPAL